MCSARRSQQPGRRSCGQLVEHVNGKHAESSVLRVARFSLAKPNGVVAPMGPTIDSAVHVLAVAASSLLPVSAPQSSADDAAHDRSYNPAILLLDSRERGYCNDLLKMGFVHILHVNFVIKWKYIILVVSWLLFR